MNRPVMVGNAAGEHFSAYDRPLTRQVSVTEGASATSVRATGDILQARGAARAAGRELGGDAGFELLIMRVDERIMDEVAPRKFADDVALAGESTRDRLRFEETHLTRHERECLILFPFLPLTENYFQNA